MGISFPTKSQTEISPTKAVTYPRHFFANREVKKIKGSRDKIVHQILHIQQNNYNSSKLLVKLNCDLKEALKVFIL